MEKCDIARPNLLPFRFIVIVFTIFSVCPYIAAADNLNNLETTSCIKKEVLNLEWVESIKAIAKLPEFSRMAKDIKEIDNRNKMTFDQIAQHYKADNKCYLEITAYEDREDENRLTYWHTFLVSSTGKVEFVNSVEGDYISLQQWRSSGYIN